MATNTQTQAAAGPNIDCPEGFHPTDGHLSGVDLSKSVASFGYADESHEPVGAVVVKSLDSSASGRFWSIEEYHFGKYGYDRVDTIGTQCEDSLSELIGEVADSIIATDE